MNQNSTPNAFPVAISIFEIATGNITTSWKSHIETLLGLGVPSHVLDSIVLESVYIGVAIAEKKLKKKATENEVEEYIQKLHEQLIMLLAEQYFDSENKINNIDAHYEEIEEVYNEFCGLRMYEYNNSTRKKMISLFTKNISDNFASENITPHTQLIDGYVKNIIHDMKNIGVIQ